jgi:hypothetical protein
LEWGTIGGGKWEGGGKEEGGGQFTINLGPEWTGVAPHAKEGFQVSKRDFGNRGGFFRQKGIIKGIHQGDCAMCSRIMLTLYISCYCVYVVLIKGLCLGYK